MLPFLVERPSERAHLEPYARTLGIAMQITNIVRDVGEDLHRLGRVYLPQVWMEQWNLTPSALGHDNLHHRAYAPFFRKLHLIVQDDYGRRKKYLLSQRRAHAPWLPSISASSIT